MTSKRFPRSGADVGSESTPKTPDCGKGAGSQQEEHAGFSDACFGGEGPFHDPPFFELRVTRPCGYAKPGVQIDELRAGACK
jgi:hypothetical protein